MLISSVILLAAASCKKSNSNNSSSSNGSISASVNGTAWANSFPLLSTYSIGGSNFQLEGIQLKGSDSTGMALVFLAPVTVNQVISSDSGWVDVEYVDAQRQAGYDGGHTVGHSILTVTSYDATNSKIAGTFSGVLYNTTGGSDSLVITNGSFSTSFTSQ